VVPTRLIDFMIDADIAVYAMARHPKILHSLGQHRSNVIAMSAIVHSQLLQGAQNAAERDAIVRLRAVISVASYDDRASLAYGVIVEQIGFSRAHTIDRMIAAHAISNGAVLVSNNMNDFARVPGLSIENWANSTL